MKAYEEFENELERLIYAAAYGAEFSKTFDPSGQPTEKYTIEHSRNRAIYCARLAIESLRKEPKS